MDVVMTWEEMKDKAQKRDVMIYQIAQFFRMPMGVFRDKFKYGFNEHEAELVKLAIENASERNMVNAELWERNRKK